jgi:hypothetical protein
MTNVLRAPALALLLLGFAAIPAQSQIKKFKEKSQTWPLSEAITRNFRFSSQQPDTVHPFRGSTA